MRKIEQQMCRAIQKNINWQSANTSVHYNEESGVSIVRLHGNKIAEIDDTTMTIYDGGHQTRTTKSRLNALCDEFCIAGEGVFQKDFEWFIRKFIGESPTTGKVYNVEDFSNGFTFAWIIMLTKKDLIESIKDTEAYKQYDHTLDREDRFNVFCNVCDNLLNERRITPQQHKKWTNVF